MRWCLILVATVVTLPACVSYERGAGITWRGDAPLAFEVGKTTEDDVLTALGPPSQLIALGERTVFYYLREETKGSAAVLIVFNRVHEDIDYDRSVFFFDADGVLTAWSASEPAP